MKAMWKVMMRGILTFLTMAIFAGGAVAESATQTKVGARAGVVDIDGLGSTIGMGAFGEVPVTDAFSIRPSIDYWQKSSGDDAGLANVEVTISDLTIGGAAKYAFSIAGSAAKPYVLGGLALHRVSAEVKSSSPGYGSDLSYESSDTDLGFDFGGGVSYALSKTMDLSGELLIRNVDTADVITVTGGLSYAL